MNYQSISEVDRSNESDQVFPEKQVIVRRVVKDEMKTMNINCVRLSVCVVVVLAVLWIAYTMFVAQKTFSETEWITNRGKARLSNLAESSKYKMIMMTGKLVKWMVLGVALICLLAITIDADMKSDSAMSLSAESQSDSDGESVESGEDCGCGGVDGDQRVSLHVYGEALCPDTSGFVHDRMQKQLFDNGLIEYVDLLYVPFGKATCKSDGDTFKCDCQHGESECKQNAAQACVIHYLVEPKAYFPPLACLQGRREVSTCIDSVPDDIKQQIEQCVNGPEAMSLLNQAGIETAKVAPRLQFVPWIVVDGKRDWDTLMHLDKHVCDAFGAQRPKPCDYV